MKIDSIRLIENKEYCREVFNFFVQNRIIKKINFSLFEKHLNKSINNLEFGNFIFKEHAYSIKRKLKSKSFYDWCIVIYYYSVYHAALALIQKSGFESKNHLASISALTYIYYHKRNLLNKEDIKFILDSFAISSEDISFIIRSKEIREKASYSIDESFTKQLAQDFGEKTADFITKVRLMLEGEIPAPGEKLKEKPQKKNPRPKSNDPDKKEVKNE